MRVSQYWIYEPSVPAGATAAAIFGILTIIHIFRLFTTRVWFCVPFVLGGICDVVEVIGFSARAIAHDHLDSIIPRIIETLFILLAPILFAASVYMILGRLMRATSGEQYSIIRVNWLTKIFVGGDGLCFLIQAAGGGIISGADDADAKHRGEMIILAGLLLQMLIFGFFLVVAWIFHKRLLAQPTGKTRSGDFNWQRFMKMLYSTSVLITFRNLFRVLEYAMGEDKYLLQNEWPIYAFDAVPMAVVLVIGLMFYVPLNQPKEQVVDLESVNSEHLMTQQAQRY
ncbi:RTA1-domain-containing protein [Cadophora sp. DSE1049]|nr:RTA1-domain-containing protein [Cadophora sp. DSE1049]